MEIEPTRSEWTDRLEQSYQYFGVEIQDDAGSYVMEYDFVQKAHPRHSQMYLVSAGVGAAVSAGVGAAVVGDAVVGDVVSAGVGAVVGIAMCLVGTVVAVVVVVVQLCAPGAHLRQHFHARVVQSYNAGEDGVTGR